MTKPFEGIFGDTVKLRLVEFFMVGYEHGGTPYSIAELAEFIDSSPDQIRPALETLIAWKIVTMFVIVEGQEVIRKYAVDSTSTIMNDMLSVNNDLITMMLQGMGPSDEEQV